MRSGPGQRVFYKEQTQRREKRRAHHHVLAEQALLLLEELLDTGRRELALLDGRRVLARVHHRVDGDLEVDQRLVQLGRVPRRVHAGLAVLGEELLRLGVLLKAREPRAVVAHGNALPQDPVQERVLRVLKHLVAHRRRGAEPRRGDRHGVHEEDVGARRRGLVPAARRGGRTLRDARSRRARERAVRSVDETDEVALVGKEAAQVRADLLRQDDALRLLPARQLVLDRCVLLLGREVRLGVLVDVHRVLGVRVVGDGGLAVGLAAAKGLHALLGEDLGALEAHGGVRAALLGDERVLDDLGVALLAVAVRKAASDQSVSACGSASDGKERGTENARSAVLAATLCAEALEELVDRPPAYVKHGAALLVLVAALVLEADLLALLRGADALRDEGVEAAAELVVRLVGRLARLVVLDVVGVGCACLGVGLGLGFGDGRGALEGRVELEGGRDEAVLEERQARDLLGELCGCQGTRERLRASERGSRTGRTCVSVRRKRWQ